MPAVVYANNSLDPYQVQLPNGTVVGAQTNVTLQAITGLRDIPSLRTGDVSKALMDGAYPGFNFMAPRVVSFDWLVALAAGQGTTEAAIQTLSAGWQNIPDPSTVVLRAGDYLRQFAGIGTALPVSVIQVQLPNRTYPLASFGRPTRYGMPIKHDGYQYGYVTIKTEWTSPEGVIYDLNVVTASCGLPNASTGLTFPATANFTFGASSGGSFTLDNTGNYQTWPYLVIAGPCSYPTIVNPSTGQWIKLNTALGSGDQIAIDTQSGAVTLNGTANRNNIVDPSSVMFSLPPGNSTLQFASTDSAQVAGTLTAYLLPAYSGV